MDICLRNKKDLNLCTCNVFSIHTLILIMSDEEHFYITLPSNASLNIFPKNKTTGYRVKLPETIDLEDCWEVGLYVIIMFSLFTR